jgi:nuclear pore complex protein Nup62
MSGFSFGQQNSGNTPNKPLFGAASNTSGGSTPSLFGTANAATPGAASSGGSTLFGGGANTGTSNLFGGGASSTPASKPGGLFGGGGATSGGSSLSGFGGSGLSKPSADAAKPSMFGGATFGSGASAATSSAPSFGFGTTACKCLW